MNFLPETQTENSLTNITSTEVGAVAAVTREQTEIQAAIISAKKFPRDEIAAYNKLLKSFERPSLAESSQYSFPRGGDKNVTGPSIGCARELARCWGNIKHGIRIVSVDDEMVHIKGYAIDLETNATVEAEDKFKKLVFRKKGGWIKPDERDLRELINRRGAILVRNSILQLIPPDVIEQIISKANDTLKKAATKSLKESREDTVRKLVAAFDGLGVSIEMLEAKLEHKINLINEVEYVELRKIFKSLQDGHTSRNEHFNFEKTASEAANDLNSLLGKKEGGSDA